ncbi:UNVERIFIED_CONTAM: sugar ABC transporter permease, partial [Bacillus mycoides]
MPAAPAVTRGRGLAGSRWEPYLYLLPALVIFTAFLAIPVVGTVALSFTAWNGISWDTAEFIGLRNYTDAFSDRRFWVAFWHNVILVPYW